MVPSWPTRSGLGKTIEAGLLIAQKWAEQKHRILVIVPANLRKQWGQELADKFFLPSAILESPDIQRIHPGRQPEPFSRTPSSFVRTSFAKKMEPYIRQTPWDLVVIDEAHRLRNVYKPTNKIANAIKQCRRPVPQGAVDGHAAAKFVAWNFMAWSASSTISPSAT